MINSIRQPRVTKGGLLLGFTMLVLAGVGVGYWISRTPADLAIPSAAGALPALAPDPRLTYQGPFRNMNPDVQYVGTAACADCHLDVVTTYQRHPMGNSVAPIAALAPKQSYDVKNHNPFEAVGSTFRVERHGEHVIQRETRLDVQGKPIFERAIEVDFAIGSGTRGISYVSNCAGHLFQTPISWYAQRNIWDLSPGFADKHVTSRPISGECMYCHANHAKFREGSVNRFDQPTTAYLAIGCERCHGPGGRHVPSMAKDDIVNPRRLEPALRDAICEQCHLEGAARLLPRGRHLDDFRPGLPLESFWTILVSAQDNAEALRAVNHVEQMHQSVCYQKSAGAKKMGCISCHNPHERPEPAQRLSFFRSRCLSCHTEQACTAPAPSRQRERDSCTACHMPPYGSADVAHTASTDHRVLKRLDAKTPFFPTARLWPDLPITPFHGGDPKQPELLRDLGIGLVMMIAQGKLEPLRYEQKALGLLEAATWRAANDVEAWQARGHLHSMSQQLWPALTAYETVLAHEPEHETALIAAAATAQGLNDSELALKYWRRAVELNPCMAKYRANLVNLLARKGVWDEVHRETEAWLKLDPGDVTARMLHIKCLLRIGKRAEASAEFAQVEALRPPNLPEFQKWFARESNR